MNAVEGLALLLALPAALLLSGYGLAAGLRPDGPAGRLATALLGGLGVQLFLVSVLNYHVPIGSRWTLLCGVPGAATLLWPFARRQLQTDLAGLWQTRRREIAVVLGGALLLFAALLWPALHNPQLVFWDGTSNHDSFFWITSAEHLKRHTYLEFAPENGPRPLWNHVNAVIGLRPAWGRMGAEGLLALVSAATGLAAIKLYVWATAALLWAWVAAGYLLFRTFLADRARPAVVAALVLFQPLFVFTLTNSNLPNLIGALCAALLLVAATHLLRPPAPAGELAAWTALAVLALHGLLCAYPEMLPFALVPCGLLALRAVVEKRWRALGWFAAALLLGCAVNWVSTARAYNGFLVSFGSARANGAWLSMVARLAPAQFLPALLTLCVPAVTWLGPAAGLGLTALLGAALVFAVARARDRFGLLAALSGGALLLAYTLSTDFGYGWQKTAQFGGVTLGVILPAGCLAGAGAPVPPKRSALFRRAFRAGGAVLLLFYGMATTWLVVRTWSWADANRKGLLLDTLALRKNPAPALHRGRVLVVPESFSAAFFHGMWAMYLLPEANLVFSPRESQPGGYLRETVVVRPPHDPQPVDAVYVSRAWAETFDANSARLVAGTAFVLLRESNLVLAMEGCSPARGVPESAATTASITLRPVRDGTFSLLLRPEAGEPDAAATIETTVTETATGHAVFFERKEGPPPWPIAAPLRAGADDRVEIRVTGAAFTGAFPLRVETIRVTDRP